MRSSLGSTTYYVNALGQRVRKTNSLGDTAYHYDAAGRLIAESTAAGALLKEYVWLGEQPIALIVSGARYYIHSDHLNTPRLGSNQSQQAVWRWDHLEPFGLTPPNDNPSGLGAFEMNLRFPGQYYDKETNLHYNHFRDYDPGIGRYVQSDPIGLRGGLNTYGYVYGNPLLFTDPRGEAGIGAAFIAAAVGMTVGAGVGAITGGIVASISGGNVQQGMVSGAIIGGLAGLLGAPFALNSQLAQVVSGQLGQGVLAGYASGLFGGFLGGVPGGLVPSLPSMISSFANADQIYVASMCK